MLMSYMGSEGHIFEFAQSHQDLLVLLKSLEGKLCIKSLSD